MITCRHCGERVVFHAGSWLHIDGLRLTCKSKFRVASPSK